LAIPVITIIAGPNGAGKTTFAFKHFEEMVKSGLFLNADEIAKKLSSKNLQSSAMQAGRKLLEQRLQFIEAGKSFVIESTLATRTLEVALRTAKIHGFKIILYYLWVSTPTLCDFRVKDRVSKGGHNIPLNNILRRYFVSAKYFKAYFEMADEVYIYSADALPTLIATKKENSLIIENPHVWECTGLLK
jgi:predicted ABC-type ATPase